jgi:hypothetical protein
LAYSQIHLLGYHNWVDLIVSPRLPDNRRDLSLPLAFGAKPWQRKAAQVETKSNFTLHTGDEGIQPFLFDSGDLATGAADQVQVWRVLSHQLVQALLIARVDHADQVQGIQQVQRAVNGGNFDTGAFLSYLGEDLLGRGRVPDLVQHQEHHFALRRQAEAALMEFIEEQSFT